MISEEKINEIIEEVLAGVKSAEVTSSLSSAEGTVDDGDIEDLTAVDLRKELLVPTPRNRDMYQRLKMTTPARIGIWRSGPRPLTRSLLRFRADHAIAQDAVFNDVSDEFVNSLGMETILSFCRDKDEFLTRPDLGRKLPKEQIARLRQLYPEKPKVLVYLADGLSSMAVETNGKDTYQALAQGLKGHGIEVTKPFFLKYGRVPSMDTVSEVVQPEVTVLLIGERPGLATGESMSCYMAYKASTTMPEANRTVISNIHKGGTPAVEAGAHIADVVKKMLEQKASGLELKL